MRTTSLWMRPRLGNACGVERVVVEEHLGDGLHHRVRLGPGVVDHPEGLAVLPAHVAGAKLGEGVDDLVLAHPRLRQRHGAHARSTAGTVRADAADDGACELVGAATGARAPPDACRWHASRHAGGDLRADAATAVARRFARSCSPLGLGVSRRRRPLRVGAGRQRRCCTPAAPYTVTVRPAGPGVRIDVIDTRPTSCPVVVPLVGTVADLTERSTTGRGLQIVATLADRGACRPPTGPRRCGQSCPGTAHEGPSAPIDRDRRTSEPPTPGQLLRYLDLPVRAAVASGIQTDEAAREVQLAELAHPTTGTPQARLLELLDESAPLRLAGRYAALRAAAEERERFDLEVVVTDESMAAVGELARRRSDATGGSTATRRRRGRGVPPMARRRDDPPAPRRAIPDRVRCRMSTPSHAATAAGPDVGVHARVPRAARRQRLRRLGGAARRRSTTRRPGEEPDYALAWFIAIGGGVAVVGLLVILRRHPAPPAPAGGGQPGARRERGCGAGRSRRWPAGWPGPSSSDDVVAALLDHLPAAVGGQGRRRRRRHRRRRARAARGRDADAATPARAGARLGDRRRCSPTASRPGCSRRSAGAATTAADQLAAGGWAMAVLPLVADDVRGLLAVSYGAGAHLRGRGARRCSRPSACWPPRAFARGRRYDAEHRASVAFQRTALPTELPRSRASPSPLATAPAPLRADGGRRLVRRARARRRPRGAARGRRGGPRDGGGGGDGPAAHRVPDDRRRCGPTRRAMVQAVSQQVEAIPNAMCSTVVCAVIDAPHRDDGLVPGRPPPPAARARRQGASCSTEAGVPPLGVAPGDRRRRSTARRSSRAT